MMKRLAVIGAALGLVWLGYSAVEASPEFWKIEWPKTDFEKTSVDFSEIMSGGPPKDGIPAINDPKFVAVSEVDDIPPTEPVVGLTLGGETKAYPLRILMWHEIVNDHVGGSPVSVTFCPLCNAAVVFDGRVGDKVLDFGTTGKLRNSDLVMYDRQTESWWQQFTGTAIVGEMLGTKLKFVPARLESFANFKKRAPNGLVQVPSVAGMRRYGANPYGGYDSSARPFLYRGEMPKNVAPLSRVVAIEGESRAWALDYLRNKRRVELDGGLVITWEPGQNSALDSGVIAEGADVGNVLVQRREGEKMVDVVYRVDFAFAYHAFHPDHPIVAE